MQCDNFLTIAGSEKVRAVAVWGGTVSVAAPLSRFLKGVGSTAGIAEIVGLTPKLHGGGAAAARLFGAAVRVSSSAHSASGIVAALAGALRVYMVDVRMRHSATEPRTCNRASERKGENRNEC